MVKNFQWHDRSELTEIGRVQSVRRHGKKLVFLNISQKAPSSTHVQIMCNLAALNSNEAVHTQWTKFFDTVKVGDAYCKLDVCSSGVIPKLTELSIAFTGIPAKSSSMQHTLKVTSVPTLLAPSLHQRPEKLLDPQTRARFPQLELEQSSKQNLLYLRSELEYSMRQFLRDRGFVHVSTPILAADTGGAVAKPFVTRATRASDHELYLRIAPELELKKLVAAGMDRVFELGPSFRNEGMTLSWYFLDYTAHKVVGLDATHNPEFTTCEFYQAYANLEDTISMTEKMFSSVTKQAAPHKAEIFSQPFERISFLSGLEKEIKKKGIDGFRFKTPLSHHTWQELVPLFPRLGISESLVSKQPRTSHVLDLLSSHLLEPLCKKPTVIMDYPAIMSPLAKSYICSETGHELAARAELFINSTEYVNMYEEENDPFAQARKFLVQKMEAMEKSSTATAAPIDQLSHQEVVQRLSAGQRYYIRVLEMGLPPTSGWGCGIERLVMLLGDAERIGDVLPFGNLRNVIAMGT
jgi:lysyl-tRNA synthetase class 2